METGTDGQQSGRLIVLTVVLLLRLPFLNQAIQGDDVYYLAGAEHAQIDPLHPNDVRYVFMGDVVDMRGHPHPPLNAWVLGLLLATFGDIHEVPFHAAYIVFSIIAALAMWSLARRFSPHPLWATLLFLATPAFVVNGNSLEADIPFLAFWMAGIALFVAEKWILSLPLLVLASLTAFQAVFATPILAVFVWLYARRSRAAWAVTLAPPAAILAWQLFERFSRGALPAAVLTGYFQTYGQQALHQKLRNAAALTIHAGWMVFPALLPPAVLISWKRRDRETVFLAAWILLFFGGALIVFFAGSARYLLPIAAPVALLVSRVRQKWLAAGFVLQLALSLSLALVNFQHWDGYRKFAQSLSNEPAHRRVWINGEWGLRYYFESLGGLPIKRSQPVQPGELVVSSELAYPVTFTTGGGTLAPIAERPITSWLPFRLIGVDSHSAYSTASKGLLPFGVSTSPIDSVRADLVVERRPTVEYLPMNAPEARNQLVSGIYELEENRWRWMGAKGVVLLKAPGAAMPLQAVFNIPNGAPGRRVVILLDGEEIAAQTYSGPGTYTLQSRAVAAKLPSATVAILIDKTFSVPGDHRQLGMVLSEIGFRK